MIYNPRSSTSRKEEYKKERRRLMNYQRRLEKRGYVFEKNLFPEDSNPAKVTNAEIQKMKEINRYSVYNRQDIFYQPDGEHYVSARTGRKIETGKISPAEVEKEITFGTTDYGGAADVIIDNFFHSISYLGKNIYNEVYKIMNQTIAENGKEETALGLQRMPDSIFDYINRGRGDSGLQVDHFFSDLIKYIPGMNGETAATLEQIGEEYYE